MVKETANPKKIIIIANANPSIFALPLLETPILRIITAILNRVYEELVFQLRVMPAVKKRQSDNLVVYAVGGFIQRKLQSQNMVFEPIELNIDIGLSSQMISKDIDDLFFSWQRIEEDEKYNELLRYNRVSILDTGALFIYNSLKGVAFLIDCLSEIIEKEQPDEIIVTDYDIVGGVVSIICEFNIPSTLFGKSANVVIRKFRMLGRFLVKWIVFIENFNRRIHLRFSGETQKGHKTLPKKIMLFVACPSDVNTIVPVVKVLEKKCSQELVILSINKSANKLLREKNLPFKTFEDYMDRELKGKIKDEERSLKAKWKVLKEDMNFRNGLKYKELPLWRLIEDQINILFTRDLKIETVGHVLDVERPDLLVTLSMGDISSLRVANRLARIKGIPTLFVSHSTYVDRSRIISTINVDKVAVCGDDLREIFITAGVDSRGIIVTGQPRFDEYFRKDNGHEDGIKKELDIDPTKGIILLIPQTNGPFPEVEAKALLKGVFGAMKEFPKHHLVIKLHPVESDKLTRKVASKMKVEDVTIIKAVDLVALLKSCDVVLTIFSNVGVEAMILDKPVVIIDLTTALASNKAKYTQGKAVARVFSAEEIAPAIRSVLEDKEVKEDLRVHRKKVVYDMAYKTDGKASERVAEIMRGMLKEKKKLPDNDSSKNQMGIAILLT